MFSEIGGKVEIFIVTNHCHIVAAIGSGIGEGIYGLWLVEIFIVTDHCHIVAAIGSGIGEGIYGLCLVRLAEKLRYS